ncbi:hypothetical protein ATCC90586_000834 [Pythium insidiosum]|nr:hypothetical protein ATCC90586_000834 [Pythium insidiosum]
MELDDIHDDALEDIDLADAADNVRGTSSEQQLSSARKHFNKFVEIHCDVPWTMDTAPHDFITTQLLGKFATYLFMNLGKLKTAQSYISQVKTFFVTKWASNTQWQLHPGNASEKWYRDIRAGMRKISIQSAGTSKAPIAVVLNSFTGFSSLTTLKAVNTNLRNITLVGDDLAMIEEFDFQDTPFSQLPSVLYEREYLSMPELRNLKISPGGGIQTLSAAEYKHAVAIVKNRSNVDFLMTAP